MGDAIDVDAVPIADELATISKADKWLSGIGQRAASLAEQYRPHEIADDADYKASKKARADARRELGAMDAERKALTADVEKFIRDFKDGAKTALEPLSGIDAEYKRQIDAYDQKWRSERLSELQDAYYEYAPDLTQLVPFEVIHERYGMEKGKQWAARSTNVVAAKSALFAAIDQIAQGEQTVADTVPMLDAEHAKAVYFSTLNVGQAIAAAHESARQRERVRELEGKRQERMSGDLSADADVSEQAPASAESVRNIGSQGLVSREEYEREYAQVMGAQAPDVRRQLINGLTDRKRLVFTFDAPLSQLALDLTDAEYQLLRTIFRNNDVHGKIRRIG